MGLKLGGRSLLLFSCRRGDVFGAQRFQLRLSASQKSLGAATVQHRIVKRRHDFRHNPVGEEHVPATLSHRLLRGAASDERLPVHGLKFDVEARTPQRSRRHDGLGLDGHDVGWLKDDNGSSVVTGLLEECLCAFHIARAGQAFRTGQCFKRRTAAEDGAADGVVVRIADQRVENILLVHRFESSLADLLLSNGG